MPAKNRVVLKSNFKAAITAGELATQDLIEKATDKMQEVAEQRLDRGASSHGYSLPREIEKEVKSKSGKIVYDHFYGRWFEYGTVKLEAMPFMRPGARAGRKIIKEEGTAKQVFEGWMTRRAMLRR